MKDQMGIAGRVAIVTGAGGGLGREYALELARRGARVVVNDLGTSKSGDGTSSEAAKQVVAEIKAAGGEAIANGGSVTLAADADAMVAQAIEAFGRIDILVSNAGFLRDSSFKKMDLDTFRAVVDVHLLGAARMIKAVWGAMSDASYGRIVLATSAAGLFGNFGQANYGAAKTGLIGLMNTLKIEGHKANIRINAISPFAATRMSEGLLPADVVEKMSARNVAGAVAFLASQEAPTGTILNAGAGYFSTTMFVETPGIVLPVEDATAERIAAEWERITDPAGAANYANALHQADAMLARIRNTPP